MVFDLFFLLRDSENDLYCYSPVFTFLIRLHVTIDRVESILFGRHAKFSAVVNGDTM